MSELRFDDRVVIVTGAGGGLGRVYARLFAARGAKVVVNDLGGTFKGEGASQSAADKVVEDITTAGGQAVANYDSVEFGQRIVQTAMDNYGRVDVVVNNAGILRDVSFAKMSQSDWDLVYKVHVYGAQQVTQAAWPIMREQQYGRVIMTASAAGIYGNFGQANYSMAKLGLFGLAQTLAIEGLRRNILVNTIAPVAGSRMTETVMPPNLIDALRPEYVAPLVARLCHESSEETGGLFEVGGGFFAKLRWERTKGKLFRIGRDITPETVDGAWEEITSFAETTHPHRVESSLQPVIENLDRGPSRGGNKFIDVDEALGYEYPAVETRYDERDVALYALGVGAASDPLDDRQLKLVYEMHGGGMQVLPTYGVVPALNAMMSLAKKGQKAPGLNFGFDRLLHGEQYTEIRRPLPTKAKLTHRARIKDIWDKGKHALVVTEISTRDEDGSELVRNELTSLVRGAGGWGGERGPSADVDTAPEREPDAVVREKIPDNQALLYRLSGDWNPLHADPGFARAFGFDKPILHGLCTFGYAGRHVISHFAPEGNPAYVKTIRSRFAKSLFPGDTLVTEMWKESPTRVIFRCKIAERDEVVISHAALELYEEIPKPAPAKKAAKKAAAPKARATSGDIFGAIGQYIVDNPDLVGQVKTTFLFKLSNPGSTWTIDLSAAPGSVKPEAGSAQCNLEISDADFMLMATGKADAMKLFTTGKLKISGDVMASQKLGFLKKLTPEMVKAQMDKRLGAAPAAAKGEAPAERSGPTSWDVFVAIRDHVERHPDLVSQVQKVFLFNISEPSSSWTLDMRAGAVAEGETVAPDCTLAISEADFIQMASGKANPMKLFTTGKLKISGDVMASQKLDFLQKIDPAAAREAVERARAAGEGPGAAKAEASPAGAQAARAPEVFAALTKRLSDKPELSGEVGALIQFRITEPESAWSVNLTGAAPEVKAGEALGAAATLTLSDADLASLASGEQSARDMYQRGKLRVDGDVAIAHRLGFFKGLV